VPHDPRQASTGRGRVVRLSARSRLSVTWCIVALALLAWPIGPARAAKRVVSLNLCTDQMLVLLAPEKIAALSHLARDPTLSCVAEQAARYPGVRPAAEAVLRYQPDLVLAARFGAAGTLALLEQLGVPVRRIDLPQDFDGIRQQVIALSRLLDVPGRGDALIAGMDARLDAAAARPAVSPEQRPTAIPWQPRGYTAGPESLNGAVLRSAGFRDVASGTRLSVEALVRNPPDLLVLPTSPALPSRATDLLAHPALAQLPKRVIPPALTICAGPFTARAVEMLAR